MSGLLQDPHLAVALAATLLATVLLAPEARAGARVIALLAAAILAWALVWRLGLGVAAAFAPWQWTDAAAAPALVTLAVALAAWVVAATALAVAGRRAESSGRAGRVAPVVAALGLAGCVLLPDLGQCGRWPPASQVLSAVVLVLAAALGVLAAGRERG